MFPGPTVSKMSTTTQQTPAAQAAAPAPTTTAPAQPTSRKALIELNSIAPDFEATTTHGPITFSKWHAGKWTILFSHPADFTPVCTTEFVEFAKRFEDFQRRNTQLIGVSIDSIYAHIAWTRNIEQTQGVKVQFPVVADLDQKVAQLFGLVHEPTSTTSAVRAVYFIDPKRAVRAIIYYPLNVGRNFDEILRVVDALQLADAQGVATPADWTPGQPVVLPAPTTTAGADERARDGKLQLTDWYLAKKKAEA